MGSGDEIGDLQTSNWKRPEFSFCDAGQKERGSENENDMSTRGMENACTTNHNTCVLVPIQQSGLFVCLFVCFS